jgi:tetratricopeptide (TPR) repeat protein
VPLVLISRTQIERRPSGARRLSVLGLALLGLAGSFSTKAADLSEARQRFLAGDYAGCLALAEKAVREDPADEDWQLLLSQGLLTTGRYPEAYTSITNALAREPRSLRLRWQAREVFLAHGKTGPANDMLDGILQNAMSRPSAYRDTPSLVVIGRAMLIKGEDPKRVLNQVFDAARKMDPASREAQLAGGELALEKHDFALAAKRFDEALKQLPDDPDLHFGKARAYAPSDDMRMLASIDAALNRNSNHIGSLLLLAEHNIDAEDYAEARDVLDRIKAINAWQPDAWAFCAVAAHLLNQPAEEREARQAALKFWPNNPRVDYLIGLKLSQKYRFAEGAAHQRQALQFDRDYLPAKAQLAQDLLRLGDEAEGWQLAQEVQKEDAYDVEAYNLAGLHDVMTKFVALTNQDFLVRMSAHEAAVYGGRVLGLLSRARSNLCAKYGLEVKRPTIVEVFPEQKDFAVRTFGMPGNLGYLGVCFGSVITANSPAARVSHPVNWEAILWHEFCHVVTLQMTYNKMPRWLSEGISVYEESQADPSWGQHMTPRYREMILEEDELTPVSRLSGAFLAPRSDEHLQFAYFESALVVEFLLKRFGTDALRAVLKDLGEGAEINQAIAEHTVPIDQIEKEFTAFAKDRAEKLAPGLDFDKPESERKAADDTAQSVKPVTRPVTRGRNPATRKAAEEAWDAWAKDRPTNFWVMTRKAAQLVEDKNWIEAKPLLQKLIEDYPDFIGPESAYRMLAAAHRSLGETNAERQVLARMVEKDDEATDAYARLMELASQTKDWREVARNAERYLAVNPLVAQPHRFLADAAEQLEDDPAGIGAYRALLELDPPDPAEVHFRLARLLHRRGDPAARRHVLQALEEAPRHRAALELLLKINSGSPQTSNRGRSVITASTP